MEAAGGRSIGRAVFRGPMGIVVRNGGEVEVVLPWDDVASVAHRRRALPGAPGRRRSPGPTTTRLPNGPATVTRVRAAVDDGAAFLDAVRRHVP